MATEVTIRFAKQEDIKAISALATSTFTEAYQSDLPIDSIKKYCNIHFNQNKILADMNSGNVYFLLLMEGEAIIGYTKMSLNEKPVQVAGLRCIQIEKIYLVKEKQNQGFGTKLMEYALQLAKDNNFEVVWVKVWEGNHAGMEFYKKLGFEEVGRIEFDFVGETMMDYFLAKRI